MQRFLMVGAIASSALVLSATACQAQPPTILVTADAAQVAQNRPQPGARMDNLNLTADQKAQIEAIHQNTRAEMSKILTAEQKAKLQTMMQSAGERSRAMAGEKPPQPMSMAELNLSAQQEQSLRQLRQQERQQIMNILTAEQREKLQQAMSKVRP